MTLRVGRSEGTLSSLFKVHTGEVQLITEDILLITVNVSIVRKYKI